MKKIVFLLAACLFAISCGGAANTTTANKPATNATSNANKPATSNSATPASTNTNADKKETAGNPDLDFTLVNKTGYDIKALSVGPAGDTEWTKEDEVLKGKMFKNGETLEIKFHPKATAEKWDLKVDWDDGDPSVEWLKLDLTTIEKITLKYNKETGVTTAVKE